MSYHGSGIDEQMYENARMAMFGNNDLEEYEDRLDDMDPFIEWAIDETSIVEDVGSKEEAIEILEKVFKNEVEQYMAQKEND